MFNAWPFVCHAATLIHTRLPLSKGGDGLKPGRYWNRVLVSYFPALQFQYCQFIDDLVWHFRRLQLSRQYPIAFALHPMEQLMHTFLLKTFWHAVTAVVWGMYRSLFLCFSLH